MDPYLLSMISLTALFFVSMFLVLGWVVMPPTAKLLLLKRLGLGGLKYKTLNMMMYDDGVAVVEAQTVSTEGLMESTRKDGTGTCFYVAAPLDNAGDDRARNLENAERDKFMLPMFSLDGFPIALSYVRTAVATNPHVLAALKYADNVSVGNPREMRAAIKIPGAARKGLTERFAEIKVLFPIDARDIRRVFPNYWGMDVIEGTKLRYQKIGALSSKKDGTKIFITLIILGAVMGGLFAVLGLLAGRFF